LIRVCPRLVTVKIVGIKLKQIDRICPRLVTVKIVGIKLKQIDKSMSKVGNSYTCSMGSICFFIQWHS